MHNFSVKKTGSCLKEEYANSVTGIMQFQRKTNSDNGVGVTCFLDDVGCDSVVGVPDDVGL